MTVESVLPEKVISRAIGAELRRAREERGWSRQQLVERLPSGIGDRTLLSYEHGTRHLTTLRLIEIGHVLETDAPRLLRRGLQRARVHLENQALEVDLCALLLDRSDAFRPMAQWARNSLNEHPDGIVEVEPAVVRNLALFTGCTHRQLADYLTRFTPDGKVGDPTLPPWSITTVRA